MSYVTSAEYLANGSVTDFVVPFNYVSRSDVAVEINDAAFYDFTFVNPGLIRISPAPINGVTVRVSRHTSLEEPAVVFQEGSPTPASNLNRSFNQLLHSLQELILTPSSGGGGGGGSQTWTTLPGKPSTFPPSTHAHPELASVSLANVSNVDFASKATAAGVAGGGGGSLEWANILNKPSFSILSTSSVAPVDNGGTGSTTPTGARASLGLAIGTDVQAYSARIASLVGLPATAGKAVVVVDANTFALADIGSGGSVGVTMPNFVTVFSGVGNGSTNNDAAFTAAEASAFERIWLPEGKFYTTRASGSFTKRYEGPGSIYFGLNGGSIAGVSIYTATTDPAIVNNSVEYGVSEDMKFTDVEYKVTKAKTRRSVDRYLTSGGAPNGYQKYFWAPSTPKFTKYIQQGGWSGLSGLLGAAVSIGATSASIQGGLAGWTVGDKVAFTTGGAGNGLESQDGIPGDIVTITAIDSPSAGFFSFTPALTKAYTLGNGVSHGSRTMQPYHLVVQDHKGGGDSYVWCARHIASYVPLASQTHIFNTSTIGIVGGDLTAGVDGNFLTAIECNTDGGAFDVGAIGLILNFQRNNDIGARGAFWNGITLKSEGTKPINSGLAMLGKMNVGLDLAGYSDFGVNKGAIAMKMGDRIHFDNTPTIRAGAGLSADTFPAQPLYIGSGDDGTKYLDINTGPYRLRARQTGALAWNGVNGFSSIGKITSVNGNIVTNKSGGQLAVPTNGSIRLSGEDGGVYITYTGSQVVLVVNSSSYVLGSG